MPNRMPVGRLAIKLPYARVFLGFAVLSFTGWLVLKAPQPAQLRPRPPVTPLRAADPAIRARIVDTYGKLPLSFEENRGQTDHEVKYLSRGNGYTLFLTSNEAVLDLKKPARHDNPRQRMLLSKLEPPEAPDSSERAAVRMKLLGADPQAQVTGAKELPGRVSYFIGDDPNKWRTNIPTYTMVKYQQVYPGVDLVYYGNQGLLEYDFVVAPGGNPKDIRLAFEGTDAAELDRQGDLLLYVAGGHIRLKKPFVYQDLDTGRKQILGSYRLESNQEVGFDLGDYEASQPVVIDPTVAYSTYLGGTNLDYGHAITSDPLGNAYITGATYSVDFPTTAGTVRPTYSGGIYDAFVVKLNASGSGIVYSTYLGGEQDDGSYDIAVDSGGYVHVTGRTQSADFPRLNALQPGCGAGVGDAMVVKLSPSGSALVYSTCVGTVHAEGGNGIAVDTAGNAYVVGNVSSGAPALSPGFPTKNALQPTFGGHSDAFVMKFDPGGALVYSTYLGGGDGDAGNDIAVDTTGNAYVTGRTISLDFPTRNAFQAGFAGGSRDIGDGFVSKLDSTGTILVYSTYLGGSGDDYAVSIAVDGAGNAYVAGTTASATFPTATPLQPTFAGDFDAFIAKFSPYGSLVYSTFLGTTGRDGTGGIAVDSAGNAYLAGRTNSTQFPTVNPRQPTYGGGLTDLFIAIVNSTGSAVLFSTYFGGSGEDVEGFHGIAVDAAGNIYVTGYTSSPDFPTRNPLLMLRGLSDAFVLKLSNQRPVASSQSVATNVNTPVSITLAGSDPDGDPVTFMVGTPPARGALSGTPPNLNYTPNLNLAGSDSFTFTVSDGILSSTAGTVSINVIDSTKPIIVSTVSPAPNAAGWNNTNVTVSWSISDPESGIASSSGCSTTTLTSDTSGATLTCSTTNGAALSNSASVTIKIDRTAPTLTFGAPSPTPNAAGWNNSNVSFPYTTADNLSGVTSSTPASPLILSAEGSAVTGAVTVSDAAGNTATFTSPAANIDKSPPTITVSRAPAANANGWNNTDVTVSFTCADALSAVAALTPPGPTTLSAEGANQSVGATCQDTAGNASAAAVGGINIDKTPPAASEVALTPNPAQINTAITVTAKVNGSATALSQIVGAEFSIDGGPFTQMTAADGAFDSASENVTGGIAVGFPSPAVHNACVRGTDAAGNVGEVSCALMAVYDPEGGFVSGAGWIQSPSGAYAAQPQLTGKALFGFTSKYQPGATVPSGNTQFHFKTADLNFKSNVYEWLVVAGARAQFKGSGSINNAGDYGFLLTAIDGQRPGGGGTDKFRIKIWDRATGAIVYDNQMGKDETGNDATELGGGSIVIHTN